MSAGALNRLNNNALAPAVRTPPPIADPLYQEIFDRQVQTRPPGVLLAIGNGQISPDDPIRHWHFTACPFAQSSSGPLGAIA
jgi:hypothetical protein